MRPDIVVGQKMHRTLALYCSPRYSHGGGKGRRPASGWSWGAVLRHCRDALAAQVSGPKIKVLLPFDDMSQVEGATAA